LAETIVAKTNNNVGAMRLIISGEKLSLV